MEPWFLEGEVKVGVLTFSPVCGTFRVYKVKPAGVPAEGAGLTFGSMALGQAVDMSLMDISKIFSLLQPKEEDEDGELCQALNKAVSEDDVALLAKLLAREEYRRRINARSGWGVPVTPLRTAAALGHLRCLELLLEHGAEVRSQLLT